MVLAEQAALPLENSAQDARKRDDEVAVGHGQAEVVGDCAGSVRVRCWWQEAQSNQNICPRRSSGN